MSANEPRSGRLSAKFDVGVNGAGLGVNGAAVSGFRFDASIARASIAGAWPGLGLTSWPSADGGDGGGSSGMRPMAS